MAKIDLKIDWCSHKAAKYACEHWHYSKCIPKSKLVKLGVWEYGKYIGCVIFGSGATPNLCKPYGLTQTTCCELVRVALTSHENSVSRIMAVSLRFLKKINPNLRLVVSFADGSQGHHGGIYQACNWVYNGTTPKARFYMINGKLTHPRTLGNVGLTQNIQGARTLDRKAETVEVQGKYRYLMPLDKEMKEQIAILAKPYPKRVKQAMTSNHEEQRQCDTDLPAPKEN